MNKAVVLSITLVALITFSLPNVYAEEGGFFDWLMKLFGGFDETKSTVETVTEEATKIQKAVIIDQLFRDFPNKSYQEKATQFLTNAGYEVDIYTTDDITVDFYKNLPSMNYDFIVLRTHSVAVHGEKPSSWLFTGQMYSDKKHTMETLLGQLSPGVPFLIDEQIGQQMTYTEAAKQRHFMIGSKFIDEGMIGNFPESTIIMAGCETLSYSFLADSFIARGASKVIGWDDLVGASSNDKAILNLLEKILVNEMEIDDAVKSVMEEDYTTNNKYNPKLKSYFTGAQAEI